VCFRKVNYFPTASSERHFDVQSLFTWEHLYVHPAPSLSWFCVRAYVWTVSALIYFCCNCRGVQVCLCCKLETSVFMHILLPSRCHGMQERCCILITVYLLMTPCIVYWDSLVQSWQIIHLHIVREPFICACVHRDHVQNSYIVQPFKVNLKLIKITTSSLPHVYACPADPKSNQ